MIKRAKILVDCVLVAFAAGIDVLMFFWCIIFNGSEKEKKMYRKLGSSGSSAKRSKEMFTYLFYGIIWISVKIIKLCQIPRQIFYRMQKPKRCEPIQNRILLYNANQLADKIRKGELKSTDIIKAYINRLQSVQPLLNAVVEERYTSAYEEAKAADEFVANGGLTPEEIAQTKPLLGVPITVKESIAVKGMTNNAGCLITSVSRGRAKEDADIVRQVKNAGAIVLAVTNTPELCMNWESVNKLTGTTNNPYNLNKTPGGSSGGESALLAAGASLLGLGSDIGGSLRVPAHYAGVWGHKPSPETVSIRGHYPSCEHPMWKEVFILGPMARYAVDLPLLLSVIAKPEAIPILRLHEEVPIQKIKVFYMEDNGGNFLTNSVDKSIKDAIKSVVMYLGSTHCIKTTKINIKLMKYGIRTTYAQLMKIDGIDHIFKGKGEGSVGEFFKQLTCRSQATFTVVAHGLAQNILGRTQILENSAKEGEEMLKVLRQEFETILGDDGVLIYPTTPSTAFYHGQVITSALDMTYCAIFNTLGLPVTNCPVCLDKNGMPIGIQVVANRNNDRLTLAVAKELEHGFGGWQPPPSSGKAPVVLQDW